MKWLYPSLDRNDIRRLAAFVFCGVLVAGLYGMAHDLITCGISPEYFSRFKFDQFPGTAGIGHLHARSACVGFLGTWWTGLIAGWLAARLKGPWWSLAVPMACAALAGVAADGWARNGGSFAAWRDLAEDRGAADVPAFLRVCAIHTAGYCGAAAGLVLMAVVSRVFPPRAGLNAT